MISGQFNKDEPGRSGDIDIGIARQNVSGPTHLRTKQRGAKNLGRLSTLCIVTDSLHCVSIHFALLMPNSMATNES